MTFEEFDKLAESLFEESRQTRDTKGREYAYHHKDRLENFKTAADMVGITPLQACTVYMAKHWLSLMSYVRHERTFSNESIRSRVVDLITYGSLWLALTLEEEENRLYQGQVIPVSGAEIAEIHEQNIPADSVISWLQKRRTEVK